MSFRRNPRGPNGRTHTAPFAKSQARREEREPAGASILVDPGESAQRNPCGPDSGPCFDRCCNKGQSSAITGPLAGWTRSRACPSHGTPVLCNCIPCIPRWFLQRAFCQPALDGFGPWQSAYFFYHFLTDSTSSGRALFVRGSPSPWILIFWKSGILFIARRKYSWYLKEEEDFWRRNWIFVWDRKMERIRMQEFLQIIFNLCSIWNNPCSKKNPTKIKLLSINERKRDQPLPKYSIRNQCPKLILFKPKQRILPIHPPSKQSLSSIPGFAASFMHRESRAPCNYPE